MAHHTTKSGYSNLSDRLNRFPQGAPPSKLLFDILKILFSEKEAELVSPGLVSEFSDRDADGNDLGTVTKSVNYSGLYMKAVKALQEAMERIETLEASNTDLLARVSALEAN